MGKPSKKAARIRQQAPSGCSTAYIFFHSDLLLDLLLDPEDGHGIFFGTSFEFHQTTLRLFSRISK
jgi:hypothetical protein